MRQRLDPQLVNGGFGDPALYVDFRDERRAVLFDLGDLARLPPRKLLRLTDVFVTHAHIDHFIGFDHLLRVVLGRKDRLRLYGGPGFIAQVEHKLAAYTWNVVHRYEVPLRLEVTELAPDRGRHAHFDSRAAFMRAGDAEFVRTDDAVHVEDAYRVRACFVDHEMPCLAYVLEAATQVAVWKSRLADLGLSTGPWLKAAKRTLLAGAPPQTAIAVAWHDAAGEHAGTRPLGELLPALQVVAGKRIGYATDLRFTEDNLAALEALLAGVDLLFIESAFLDAEAGHAARKNHLTAKQAGAIARRVGAKAVLPFHFSPRYEGRAAELVAEVQAAWADAP
jgi:ribonuclease Z